VHASRYNRHFEGNLAATRAITWTNGRAKRGRRTWPRRGALLLSDRLLNTARTSSTNLVGLAASTRSHLAASPANSSRRRRGNRRPPRDRSGPCIDRAGNSLNPPGSLAVDVDLDSVRPTAGDVMPLAVIDLGVPDAAGKVLRAVPDVTAGRRSTFLVEYDAGDARVAARRARYLNAPG